MALELYDKDFLLELDNYSQRTIYCKIIALNWKEQPIAEITSNIVSGSININGSSAVRRTASLSLVTDDLKVDTMVWRAQTKIQIFIGLKNYLKNKYPNYEDIIWFPQGIYVITSFNSSFSTSGYTINISAKDKMCLLNGDISGKLWASHDFSQLYITKKDGNIVKTYIPIYDIIKEAIHTYALEPYSNIIINDLDDCGVELLEYIGTNATMYIFKHAKNANSQGAIWTYQIAFDTNSKGLIDILEDAIEQNNGVAEGAEYKPNGSDITYIVLKKISSNSIDKIAGYRATDLTYPGELVIPVGGTINELLNKIVTLLGEFEYFYNLNGQFVFQRKKIYINSVWTNVQKNANEKYYESISTATDLAYDFSNANLINTFTNTPSLSSIKNDFSIWGTRKTANNTDMSVHLRYAIDKKPLYYYSLLKHKLFIANNVNMLNIPSDIDLDNYGDYDWRELIYQMAEDNLYADTAIASLKLALKINNLYHYDLSKLEWDQNHDFYKYNVQTKKFDKIQKEQEFLNCKAHNIFIFGEDSQKADNKLTTEQIEQISAAIGCEYRLYQIGYPWSPIQKTSEIDNRIQTMLNTFKSSERELKLIQEIQEWQETYITGYEAYYTDILGFWRYMYKIEPDFIVDRDKYIQEGYEFKSESKNEKSETVVVYEDENGKQITVYYGFDQIDRVVWEEEWQYNGYWNPDLFAYNKNTKIIQMKDPTALYFWLDFCDTNYDLGELSQYDVQLIGRRSHYINDKDVKAIYFQETPNLVFINPEDEEIEGADNLNYCKINIVPPISNYFQISSQGKSAKEVLDSLLYEYTCARENISMQIVPIYYLEPNTRIRVFDENSNINGEYIIQSFSIPLNYDGLMNISAKRAAKRVI